jgi:4-amino-4-deoxy-L-arabinose transferase-like glycosyltransferase
LNVTHSRFRSILAPTLLALAAAALYVPRLEDAPRYLVTDELFSALTAHSVATTGRDPHGSFMPLYFQMDLPKSGRPMWFQPILIYAMALALKVRPLSEAAVRLPVAIVGIADVVLMYFVARQLFGRQRFAVAAAALLAVTPAHFVYSRYAMDFPVPLPFILAWLLCLARYLKRPDGRLLFAGGLALGIGVYSYIAAAAFMPFYALLTCIVLLMRREPVRRCAALAAGFILPVLLVLRALMRNPTLLRDVAAHYRPDGAPAATGAMESFATIVNPSRLADAATLYVGFWKPRFLFIEGPVLHMDAVWQAGVFLLPFAGLLLLGLARTMRRPFAPTAFVLLAGLLTAPIPASFAGQGEAIRRALELLPFAVLVGVFGLETFWAARLDVARIAGFVAFWSVVLALTIASHDIVPHAQAYVRAASVPLGIAGLALVMDRVSFAAVPRERLTVAVLLALGLAQVAFWRGAPWLPLAALAGAFALAVILRGRSAHVATKQLAITVLLALVASQFTFEYVDYPARRIGPVPASAFLATIRLAAAALVMGAMLAAAHTARRLADRLSDETVASIAVVVALCVQIAYFYVDLFSNPILRFLHVAAVVAAAAGVAAWSKPGAPATHRLGPLTAIGVLGLAALQFGYFYSDYFTSFQARGSVMAPGNVRVGLEAALDRAGSRPVPAIYLARVRNESPGLGNLYAQFYLLKKHRPDLIDRTIEGDDYMGFEVDRVAALPAGTAGAVPNRWLSA